MFALLTEVSSGKWCMAASGPHHSEWGYQLMGLDLETHWVKKKKKTTKKTHVQCYSNRVAHLCTQTALIPINTSRNLSVMTPFANKKNLVNLKKRVVFSWSFLPRATVPIRKGFPIWVKSFLVSWWISEPTTNVTATLGQGNYDTLTPWGAKKECPMQFRLLIDSHFIWHLQGYTKVSKKKGMIMDACVALSEVIGNALEEHDQKKWFNTKWNGFMAWPQRWWGCSSIEKMY